MTTQLTEHFTAYEMYRSKRGEAKGLDNTPSVEIMDNLLIVAHKLERLRTMLSDARGVDVAITINSGYRSPAVNKLVGGSDTSDHLNGLAVDIIAPTFGTAKEICEFIRDHKPFEWDQLIFEQTWCHVGFGKRARRQVFSMKGSRKADGIVDL